MKRRLAAILCALLLAVSALPAASALEGEDLRAADTLATLGLIDGTYDLTAPATRAQAAALLVRLAGGEAAAAADTWISGFRDVPAAIAEEVDYAARQGWVTGVTTVEFRPGEPLTANAWSRLPAADAGLVRQGRGLRGVRRRRLCPAGGPVLRIAYSGALTQGDLFETAADALSFSFRDGSGTVARRLVRPGGRLPRGRQRPGAADSRPHRPAGGGPLLRRRVPAGHL